MIYEKLVFLDESGVNIGLTRNYGRSFGQERIKDSVPFNRPVRTIGVIHRKILCPTLKLNEIVIMDNLSSHKVSVVKEWIEAVGAKVKYLPPYSPDFNPIELLPEAN